MVCDLVISCILQYMLLNDLCSKKDELELKLELRPLLSVHTIVLEEVNIEY